jgi:hypothetical protein
MNSTRTEIADGLSFEMLAAMTHPKHPLRTEKDSFKHFPLLDHPLRAVTPSDTDSDSMSLDGSITIRAVRTDGKYLECRNGDKAQAKSDHEFSLLVVYKDKQEILRHVTSPPLALKTGQFLTLAFRTHYMKTKLGARPAVGAIVSTVDLVAIEPI